MVLLLLFLNVLGVVSLTGGGVGLFSTHLFTVSLFASARFIKIKGLGPLGHLQGGVLEKTRTVIIKSTPFTDLPDDM